jgi:hypothetical protein
MTQRLFTPGPLTTDPRVRQAMQADWGSRDAAFIALTAEMRQRLLDVAHGGASHVAVPLQGSGTFILEAAVGTLVGRDHKLLVLINGAYGRRLAAIGRRLGLRVETLDHPENQPADVERLAAALAADPTITHVSLVHVETTTGLLNPLEAVARAVKDAGRLLLLDAMASFGALPLDLAATPVAAVLASSNKGLEGPPGLGFALVERTVLEESADRIPLYPLTFTDNGAGLRPTASGVSRRRCRSSRAWSKPCGCWRPKAVRRRASAAIGASSTGWSRVWPPWAIVSISTLPCNRRSSSPSFRRPAGRSTSRRCTTGSRRAAW